MNVRDSQWLARTLAARGFAQSPPNEANVVIINTCAVREKPERKVASLIGQLRRELAGRDDAIIAVLGCVAQSRGEELYELDPRVRLVAGGDNVAAAPDAIEDLLANPTKRVAKTSFSPVYDERAPDASGGEASVFVNIMRGCDNFCAYCIVPFTRGRQRSRSLAAIMEECKRGLDAGAREITLLGQNVNAWGKDTGEANFEVLLERVAALPGLARLRFVSPHPADMSGGVIAAFGHSNTLCPRIHLPLQAGSDKILKKMNRRYTAARYIELVENLRAQRPDIAVSADIIVGFPGESETDFAETLRVMEECGFMSSYSFCYSDRPGTRASLMPDKISREESLERLARLQELQDKLSETWLRQRVGQTVDVLLEGSSARGGPNSWQGRDVYGATINVETPNGHAGEIARVKIVAAKKHSLNAEPVG